METVVATDITKNDRGWYEITLQGDERKLSTKEKKIADAVNASLNSPIQVEVNERQNGTFTNYFLNAVEPAAGGSAPVSAPPEIRSTESAQDARQERIARQWAYGRAIDVYAASGGSLGGLLDTDTFNTVKAVADALYLASAPAQ